MGSIGQNKEPGGMGFRDLELFNLALLRKHGWRLMTDPESLCGRILKTKYFPDSDVMQASVPRSASATWRAIVAGREALSLGLIKRIGDGTSVSIWTDKWIPGVRSMTPSVHIGNTSLNTVSELIDFENWTWKDTVIRNNFIPPEADAIMNIPLRSGGGEDFWAWNLEKSGNYIVKTSYRALMTRNEQSALAEGMITGSSVCEKQLWDRLWKLKVVPKVRVFWWRVLRGILPVEQTLQYRHITTLARCKVCLAADEDMRHALLRCTHAMRFWSEARVLLDVKIPDLHPVTWAKDVLIDPIVPEEDRAKVITIMWAIWTSGWFGSCTVDEEDEG
jgi:hypothetical protein